MDHASLVAFLEGKLTPEQFADEVADEVRACNWACKQTGEGRVFITPGPETIITRDYARRLLEAVAGQRLSLEVANYATACIIFGYFEFVDDVVNEAVWLIEMADLDKPSTDDMRTAIDKLALQ